MFFKSKRLIERAEGIELLRDILKDKNKSIIIHYSCESFVTAHGRTPRVTSISTRFLGNAITKSFSIHLQAQFDGKDFNNLSEEEYDDLERKMLLSFYEFVKSHKEYKWIHWNMRDANFGFEAIGNRFRILRGTPEEISEDRKFDFPRILGKVYTYDYEENQPDGRLLNLAKRNGISIIDALKGMEEAEAFEKKEYLKLFKSTLRKVDIIDAIINRTDKGELRVATSPIQIYGLSFPGVIEIVKSNWILIALWTLLVYLLGIITEPIIQKALGIYN